MPPLKILLVPSAFSPLVGGAAVVYDYLCHYLKDDLAVIAPWRYYQDMKEFEGWRESDSRLPCRVKRIELLRPPLRSAPVGPIAALWRYLSEDLTFRRRILRSVLEYCREVSPQVVCIGDLYALAWLAHELRNRVGLPIVHYAHGDDVSRWTNSRTYSREAFRALKDAAAVVAVSNFARDRLLQFGARPDRVHVVTNGVDTHRFRAGPKDPEIVARHALQGKKILLTVTRLEERKGVDTVIHAMPRILKAIPDAVFVVVGDGTYRLRLEAISAELGLSGKVFFRGLVPYHSEELVRYYQTCDLFLMPNRELANGEAEGFGLVFLEAGACGKPVIGGNTGGVADAVADGETGILVGGMSTEEVADAAVRLLTDPALAARMGAAGLRKAQQAAWGNKALEFRAICSAAAATRQEAV